MKTFECDFCAFGDLAPKLPDGWSEIDHEKHGKLLKCKTCNEADAEKAAQRPSRQFGDVDIEVSVQSLTETSKDKLRAYITRIENLEAEKAEINDQIHDIYGDAKALGFDTKAIRTVIKLRAKDEKKVAEENQMVDLYLYALGMI